MAVSKLISHTHWYCPKCYPALVYGQTRALCGWVVHEPLPQPPGGVKFRKCPACTPQIRGHKASHR
jgi:hypothetical protein